MHVRVASCLLLLAMLSGSGCANIGAPGGIPWWVGLPCLVIAPNSLEAEVWHEHLHASSHGAEPLSPAVQEVEFAAELTLDQEELPPPEVIVPDAGDAVQPFAPGSP